MSITRLFLVLLAGTALLLLTYNSKYQVGLLDAFAWIFFIVVGSTVYLSTMAADLLQYLKERKWLAFVPTITAIVMIGIVFWMENRISNDFEKPSLIKTHYDGDINGAGFDFKTDGTYIFNNAAIGFSSYTYGKYKINGNQITLDRDKIDNIIVSRKLGIIEKTVYKMPEKFLSQKHDKGNSIENALEFRIIEDNRK